MIGYIIAAFAGLIAFIAQLMLANKTLKNQKSEAEAKALTQSDLDKLAAQAKVSNEAERDYSQSANDFKSKHGDGSDPDTKP